MAANSGGVRAGKAFVELYADKSKLVRGLKSASQSLKSWGASVSSIGKTIAVAGAAMAAPLVASAKIFSSLGSDLNDMSARTGVSVEALSSLGFAAGQAGASTGTLEVSIKKMQKAIGDAVHGEKAGTDALKNLGLTIKDLLGLSPDDQFRLIAKRIAEIKNPALKSAAAIEIFGRSGTQLLPMIGELEALEKQAHDLGLVISGEDATAADDLGDSFSSLYAMLKVTAFQIGAALAPTLQELAGVLKGTIKGVIDFVTRNRTMIVTIAKVVAGVVAAGVALFAAGTIISGIGSAIGLMVMVASGFLAVISAVGSVLAFLISPVGLLIAGIAALAMWFVTSTEAGQNLARGLSEAFVGLWSDAVAAFGGIRDAIMAGDLSLAMRIVGNLLKIEWQKAVSFLQGYWIAFTEVFQSAWTSAVFAIAGVFTNISATLQAAWQETTDFISDAWSLMWGGMKKVFFETIGFIKSAWVRLKGLFDSDIDVEAEVSKISAETAGKTEGVDAGRDAAIFAREQERQKKLAAIEAARVGALDELQRAQEAKNLARQEAAAKSLAETEAELLQAQAEFKDSVAEAAAKRKEAESKITAGKLGRGATDGLEQATAKTSVAGTFSAAAVRGLGGNALGDIRTATQQAAKFLKKIADDDDGVGLEVA